MTEPKRGDVGLNPTNSVACTVCGVLVLAVDVQARTDPRVHRRWEGRALLCPTCASTVDRKLIEAGRR